MISESELELEHGENSAEETKRSVAQLGSVLVEVRPRSCGEVGANWRKFWLLVCPSRSVALFPFGRKRIQLSHPAVNLRVELHLLDPEI